jgi:hypothetical protein
MGAVSPSRRPAEAEFTTVADGVRAQVVRGQQLLPPHLTSSAHEGRSAACRCRPLLEQLTTVQQWPVVPRGAREACTQEASALSEEHDMRPLRLARWPGAPAALAGQAWQGLVELALTMCGFCGAVEVRDISFNAAAGLRRGALAPRRRSRILGWYSGKRPAGRIYL